MSNTRQLIRQCYQSQGWSKLRAKGEVTKSQGCSKLLVRAAPQAQTTASRRWSAPRSLPHSLHRTWGLGCAPSPCEEDQEAAYTRPLTCLCSHWEIAAAAKRVSACSSLATQQRHSFQTTDGGRTHRETHASANPPAGRRLPGSAPCRRAAASCAPPAAGAGRPATTCRKWSARHRCCTQQRCMSACWQKLDTPGAAAALFACLRGVLRSKQRQLTCRQARRAP